MVDAKDFFSGNFLKAEDCKGGEICELLDEGSVEEIKTSEGKIKSVLNFQIKVDGKEKIFTPNRTNGNIMVDAWGKESDKWVGKKFKITLVKVSVFGKIKNSIVIEPVVK